MLAPRSILLLSQTGLGTVHGVQFHNDIYIYRPIYIYISLCGKVYRPIVISIYCMMIELPSGSTVKHDKILTPDEK